MLNDLKVQCNALEASGISFIFLYKHGGKIHSFGKKEARNVIDSVITKLDEAFDHDNNVDTNDSNISKMKSPLSLSNAHEVRDYARYLISNEYTENNPSKKKKNGNTAIKYAHPDWKPRFWPEDIVSWSKITKNFSNLTKADLADKCSITELLTVFIKRSLEGNNLDPERHYFNGTFTEKIEKKRRTNRGLSNKMTNKHNIDDSDSDSSVTIAGSSKSSDNISKSSTIDRLLRVPSLETQIKEQREVDDMKKMERNRKLESQKVDEEVERLDKEKNDMIKQRESELEIGKKLQIYSMQLRQTLSLERIKEIFESNLQIFDNIRAGVQDSWRHKMYKDSRNKTANINFLRSRMISFPFSEQQQDAIYSHVKNRWLFDRRLYMSDYEYVDYVLLPEVFIKIYQVYFNLESPNIAEERIFNALGSLPPEELNDDSIFIN